MILSVTLNPSVDHALFLDTLRLGDTNRVQRVEKDAGGKGVNLSRVVAELGGNTLATGFLGGGPGAYVRAVLDRQGVAHDFVEVAGDTRSNFSVEDESDAPPTTFNERGPSISAEELERLLALIRRHAPQASWAGFGGSIPPGVPVDAFRTIGEICAAAGCCLMLDADGAAAIAGLDVHPHFIKPNAKEAGRLLGREVETLEDAAAAARELLPRLAPKDSFVVVSRGADGAVLASADGTWNGVSPEVDVRSTIGSGDSLIGGMLWALEADMDLVQAFRWGLAAGAATATTDGSEIARRAQIEALFPRAITQPL